MDKISIEITTVTVTYVLQYFTIMKLVMIVNISFSKYTCNRWLKTKWLNTVVTCYMRHLNYTTVPAVTLVIFGHNFFICSITLHLGEFQSTAIGEKKKN